MNVISTHDFKIFVWCVLGFGYLIVAIFAVAVDELQRRIKKLEKKIGA